MNEGRQNSFFPHFTHFFFKKITYYLASWSLNWYNKEEEMERQELKKEGLEKRDR
jgi:hypothetical protein